MRDRRPVIGWRMCPNCTTGVDEVDGSFSRTCPVCYGVREIPVREGDPVPPEIILRSRPEKEGS